MQNNEIFMQKTFFDKSDFRDFLPKSIETSTTGSVVWRLLCDVFCVTPVVWLLFFDVVIVTYVVGRILCDVARVILVMWRLLGDAWCVTSVVWRQSKQPSFLYGEMIE